MYTIIVQITHTLCLILCYHIAMNQQPITYGDIAKELKDAATVNEHMYKPQPSMPEMEPPLLRTIKLQTVDEISSLNQIGLDALKPDLNINTTDVIPPEQLHGFTRLREENKFVGGKMRGRGQLLKDIRRRADRTLKTLKTDKPQINVMSQVRIGDNAPVFTNKALTIEDIEARLNKYKEALSYILDRNQEYDKSLLEALEALAKYDDRYMDEDEFSQVAMNAYNAILDKVPLIYHPKEVSSISIEAMRTQLSEGSMAVARQLRALEEEIKMQKEPKPEGWKPPEHGAEDARIVKETIRDRAISNKGTPSTYNQDVSDILGQAQKSNRDKTTRPPIKDFADLGDLMVSAKPEDRQSSGVPKAETPEEMMRNALRG